ncbi:MAG: sodium/proton-translocating pyrophosphatase, partial [Lentisphaeria bacterium]|nr:sodium/proton-translocating pyrophosphatase [Lentisphaeria bacterium]
MRRLIVAGMSLPLCTVYAAENIEKAAETFTIQNLLFIAPIGAIAALITAYIFFNKVKAADPGNETMQRIAGYVREGARAYLNSQFKSVCIVVAVLFVVFCVMAGYGLQNTLVPVAFVMGAMFSALCGFLGMSTATMASNRTAQGASESLNAGLQIAFRSGAVMGLVVVGFGLLNLFVWYILLDKVVYTPEHMTDGWLFIIEKGYNVDNRLLDITSTMMGFGIGASLQALFAR